MPVKQQIEEIFPQVIAWRRHLHENPELSFEEYETADFIEETLRSFDVGLDISRPTPTSIIARLIGKEPGRVLGLRADIDALPIEEEVDVPFKSKKPGVMHACGHDAHTAMLLGAVKLLAQHKDNLKGEIRFIFQHAEEKFPGGASEIVATGAVDDVDEFLGLHVFSSLPKNLVGVCSGFMTSNSDAFEIEIVGKGGHSSQPENSNNPIIIGAQVVNALNIIPSQRVQTGEKVVLGTTTFHAGIATNVIPERVTIGGSVRTFSQEVRETVAKEIEKQTTNIVEAFGGTCTVNYTWGYTGVYNDEALTEEIVNIISETIGEESVLRVPPLMGGEDFSAYLTKAPGVFLGIGVKPDDDALVYPHHHPRLLIDEDGLKLGIEVLVQAALKKNVAVTV